MEGRLTIEGSSSIDADLQLPEILAHDRRALSFLIAAIRQMQDVAAAVSTEEKVTKQRKPPQAEE